MSKNMFLELGYSLEIVNNERRKEEIKNACIRKKL